jgi:NOL1/NOP2/fmu family ribosome biogenesis protein
MSNIRFIKTPEKRRIIEQLEIQFGITKLPYLLLGVGKEKMRAFSGSLSKEEIIKLSKLANIDLLGIYLIKEESGFRLSFDATQILKNQITKNIIEINDEQYEKWIRGHDLELNMPQGTYIIKYGHDFLGCGRSNGTVMFNYVPKDRRLKTQIKS